MNLDSYTAENHADMDEALRAWMDENQGRNGPTPAMVLPEMMKQWAEARMFKDVGEFNKFVDATEDGAGVVEIVKVMMANPSISFEKCRRLSEYSFSCSPSQTVSHMFAQRSCKTQNQRIVWLSVSTRVSAPDITSQKYCADEISVVRD